MKILEEIKINYPNLSNVLYERIKRYLKYNKSKYKYNIKYVLDSLPSSIQNNLIIEIYRPIIKNFLFFKYFENSDFFVKIVTSMKPILSMKDDILINEGDVIEDIIFIKKGRLSLEVEINLDVHQNNNFDDENQKSTSSITNKMNTISSFKSLYHTKNEEKNFYFSYLNFTTKKTNTFKFEKNQNQKKQIKIIELRNNEHFGDVLMILNEKSPVTIKVRSKKAELLFLPKTDATEISNLYPNIWKRIVTKSLYNLNQIKNIIKKRVLLYCKLNDIPLDEKFTKKHNEHNDEVKFKINRKNQFGRKKKNNINFIIKEVDESNFISPKNTNISKKIFSQKHLNIKINKEKNNDNTSIMNGKKPLNVNNKANISNKNESMLKDNKIINNTISDLNQNNINLFIEENKNDNKEKKVDLKSNIINYNKEIINQTKLDNMILNTKIEDENLERINEEIFFNEELETNIINRRISMNNYDKNNYIFHQISNNKNNKLISQNNSFDKIYKLINGNIMSDVNAERVIIDNNSVHSYKGNQKINIYNNIVINNSRKNNNVVNADCTKKNKFDILENSTADSFSINSTYENINKISKYKYANNKYLQPKIKKILFQPFLSSIQTIHSAKNMLSKVDSPLSKNNKNKNIFYHSAEKNKFENDISPAKTQFIRPKIIKLLQNDEKQRINKESHIRAKSNDIEDINFYTQIKMKTRKSCKYFCKLRKISNYEDKISKNIENNKQNLNNPKEYFSGLFNKILDKKRK